MPATMSTLCAQISAAVPPEAALMASAQDDASAVEEAMLRVVGAIVSANDQVDGAHRRGMDMHVAMKATPLQ